MPMQGQSFALAGPSLRGECRDKVEGSLANGLETTTSLNDGSVHVGEHAMPGDNFRIVSPARGSLYREVIKIS